MALIIGGATRGTTGVDRVGIIYTIPRNKRDALKDAPRRVPVMIDPSPG